MKRLFRMTYGERAGSLILLLLIGIVIICNIPDSQNSHSEESFFYIDSAFQEEVNQYIAKFTYTEFPNKRERGNDKIEYVLFSFDPNKTDSASFTRLGLPSYVAANIQKYRKKGGIFRKKKDFARIYGIDSSKYQELFPYIQIDSSVFITKKDTLKLKKDTFPSFKFKEKQLVDLNRADTALLKKIPGIGSGYSSMIISYRRQLGGYYSNDQIQEIQHIPDSVKSMLKEWLTVTSSPEQKIPINKASMERLYNHPYLNFYQAKAIYEIRKKRGIIRHINELSLLDEFTETDLERLSHYFDFSS